MKIAMIIKYFNFRNGSSRVTHEISTRLIARGHEVHIFCNRTPGSYPKKPILHRVPMLRLGSWAKVLSFSVRCARFLQRERFDIIHGHGNSLYQDLITAHVCHRANLMARGLPLTRGDPGLWIERRQFENPKLLRIITLSEMSRKDLHLHYGIPLDRMVTIRNGVDSERFHPDARGRYRKMMRRRHGIKEDEFLALFVASGNFMNRGLLNLYAALEQVSDLRIRVMVIGKDNWPAYSYEAKRRGILSKLVFVPFTEKAEAYYGMGDALVFPSCYDTFGLVVLEAMACGLPVMVSAQAGVSELITDGRDGLILKDPGDSYALAHLLRVLEDPGQRERMGQAARTTALYYTWDTVAEKTIAEYKKVIDSGQ